MLKKLVYIVGGDYAYADMFKSRGWDVTKDMNIADLVQFTGGEDVNPALYNEQPHRTTHFNARRDEKEVELYEKCIRMGIPMTGICRGGQFLNVMNGGSMWQNVDGHGGKHIANVAGYIGDVLVSSTHHQMMRPKGDYIVLMTARMSTRKEHMGEGYVITRHIGGHNVEDDIECVYYPDTHSLCYQPHPEFNNVNECRDVYFHFINNYLLSNTTMEDSAQRMIDARMQKAHVASIISNTVLS